MTTTTDTPEDKAETIGLPYPNKRRKIVDPDTGRTAASARSAKSARAAITSCSAISKCPTPPPRRSTARGGCTPAIWLPWTIAAIARPGPPQGHDHPRRREHLSARDRGSAVTHPRRRGRGLRRARTRNGARKSPPSSGLRRARCRQGGAPRLHSRLARPHKSPRHWFRGRIFPLTGSGKIQKFKLREEWTKGDLAAL